jgi:flagellar motor switch protein FliM
VADNILSQEEIDALLKAMDRGEIEVSSTGGKKAEVVAKPYDLTSQSVVLRNQFHALEEIYDKFCNLLNQGVGATFQTGIEISLISSERVKFGEFIQAFSNPTHFNLFAMEPLIGNSILAIEPGLVFSLIDCMFGGSGKPLKHMREFTLIETRMMKKFAGEVLKSLEKAWEAVFTVHIVAKKIETKPEFVHLAPADDLMIVVVLNFKGAEFNGNVHLCTPYRMLEPIKDRLASKFISEKDMEEAFTSQLQQLLRDTPVTLVSELGRTFHTVRDLLSLQLDDVLRLNTGPEDPIVVNVEMIPKFLGVPGIIRGNRAVQVTRLIR